MELFNYCKIKIFNLCSEPMISDTAAIKKIKILFKNFVPGYYVNGTDLACI
jgi:hypothetical protein